MIKKRLLSSIISATFICSIFLFTTKVQAFQVKDNQTVDSKKIWTIKFTDEVGYDDSTIKDINVKNSKGSKVSVTLELGADKKTIKVNPPKEGYVLGEQYILNVGTNAHSKKGKNLRQVRSIHFNVKDTNDKVVTFTDKNLEKAVRDAIDKPNGEIYKSDAEKITKIWAYSMNIKDISGIENLTNLQTLQLNVNSITNIEPLRNLTNLEALSIGTNNISNIDALKNLTNLQELYLGNNPIGNNIEVLKNLTNLKKLNLSQNNVSNIEVLKNLTKLKELSLFRNNISNIDTLKNLTNLQEIYIYDNPITNIEPLKDLTNLRKVSLMDTPVSNIEPLRNLTKLEWLNLSGSQVSNVDALKGLINLKELQIYNTSVNSTDLMLLEEALPSCKIR